MTASTERLGLYDRTIVTYLKDNLSKDYIKRGRNFWSDIAVPFLNNLDGLILPASATDMFEQELGRKSPFGIEAATKQVMIASLRLKNEEVFGIVPDDKVLQTIGLWFHTLSGLEIKTFDKHDNNYLNTRLYGGDRSFIFANDEELTFIGNPNDQVVPLPKADDKPTNALDLIKKQLITRYGLTDKEVELALNDIADRPGAIIHLQQKHTNGLTSFSLRVGDLSTTKVVAFGANGYHRTPGQDESKRVRIVFESPDEQPVYFSRINDENNFEPVTAENLGVNVQLIKISGVKQYRLDISNSDTSKLLDSGGYLSLEDRESYYSIGFN